MSVPVTVALEGPTDKPLARKILARAGLELGEVFGLRGKAHLDVNLQGFNAAAAWAPWFVLRDLDADAPCAAALVKAKLQQPAPLMRFRVAVREGEAWLLGDRLGVARFFHVPIAKVPLRPEQLANPKQTLVNLARRSKRREVRRGMVPAKGISAVVGPEYTALVIDFVTNHWRVEVAAAQCPSLARCVAALRTLAA